MTAGSGVTHSEFNHSKTQRVHLLQVWILPRERGLPPGYGQKSFADRLAAGGVFPVASPDGRDGSLRIHQDATLSIAKLAPGQRASVPIAPGRALWAQVARGSLSLSGVALAQGDGAAVEKEPSVELVAGPQGVEALVFDLA
jgi:redox-sensitive bicupin YhaK (pirin superfamily)